MGGMPLHPAGINLDISNKPIITISYRALEASFIRPWKAQQLHNFVKNSRLCNKYPKRRNLCTLTGCVGVAGFVVHP
jgi:hypothetical protein